MRAVSITATRWSSRARSGRPMRSPCARRRDRPDRLALPAERARRAARGLASAGFEPTGLLPRTPTSTTCSGGSPIRAGARRGGVDRRAPAARAGRRAARAARLRRRVLRASARRRCRSARCRRCRCPGQVDLGDEASRSSCTRPRATPPTARRSSPAGSACSSWGTTSRRSRSPGSPPEAARWNTAPRWRGSRRSSRPRDGGGPGHGPPSDRTTALRLIDEDGAYLDALERGDERVTLPKGRDSKAQRKIHAENLTRV